jgi:hypothetical protein
MPDYALYRSPVNKNPERWRIDEMLPPAFEKNSTTATRRRKKHGDYPDYPTAKAAYDRLTGASHGRP